MWHHVSTTVPAALKIMIGNDTITALLETFQESKERGEQATLILETRNGVQFATFKVKLPDSHRTVKTSLESAKKKSPSTVKRDKERLEKFNQRKKLLQEDCSFKCSTPSSKYELQEEQDSNQDMVTPALDNEMVKRASETVDEEPGDTTDFEQDDVEKLENSLSKALKKANAECDQILQDLMANMITKSDISKSDDKIEEDNDNIEDAKLWAMNQKQDFTLK